METFLRLVLLDLVRVVSSGRLHWQMYQCILCLEFAGSGGIRSCAPMLLFRPFGSGGSGVKLRSLLPSGEFCSMVKSEADNIMKAGLED
jgi:hypothetical protein